ncbi:hypothetical protein ABW20_dc0101987 [Dactylellina cionopaga]|nr:hypothetical protein ABW20_dc0101987 [Dactylellina cionopaga]
MTNDPFYTLPPVGDATYRPLHLTPPQARYDPETDPIFRLPTPQIIPPLPLIRDKDLYFRVFTMPWISLPSSHDRHELEVLGDGIFEWMVQCVLHQEYGHIVRVHFGDEYEDLILKNLVNSEQARYFAHLYDFGSRICSDIILTPVEVQTFLPDILFAYIGAIGKTRGKGVTLRWLRDLVRPILEYRVRDITSSWPKSRYKEGMEEWHFDQKNGYLPAEYKVRAKDYEVSDCEWMAVEENQDIFGDEVEKVCTGLLKVRPYSLFFRSLKP